MTKSHKRILILALSLAALLAGISALWPTGGGHDAAEPETAAAEAAPFAPIDPTDAAALALGQKLYARECAACHGSNLEGQPNWQQRLPNGRLPAPPHDASGHTWHHADAHLFAITKHSLAPFAGPDYQTDMPAYAEKLTDAEIRAVIAFIKSTWPAEQRATQAEISKTAP
jgi:mono/diheme cytochrome c family protein